MEPSWRPTRTRWEAVPHKKEVLAAWRKRLSGDTTLDTRRWPSELADVGTRHTGLTSVFAVPATIVRKLRYELNEELSLFTTVLLQIHNIQTPPCADIGVSERRRCPYNKCNRKHDLHDGCQIRHRGWWRRDLIRLRQENGTFCQLFKGLLTRARREGSWHYQLNQLLGKLSHMCD